MASIPISILGAGSFGTALAHLFADDGHPVTLYCRNQDRAKDLVRRRTSSHLPGIQLSSDFRVTTTLSEAVAAAGLVLLTVPAEHLRTLLLDVRPHLPPQTLLINCAKGLEIDTFLTLDQVMAQVLPPDLSKRAAFLSGPTFALELAQKLPTAMVVASRVHTAAERVQQTFSSERLRIYTSEDVIGVLLAGALKNVCAIGAGIGDGLGFGNNARAAFITRGLWEMTRLGVRMGAHPLTFSGLAGVGDLVLTCTGDLSRNRRVGVELGKGKSLAEVMATITGVAEGTRTAAAAYRLAHQLGVDMPIIQAIYEVLYHGKSPRQAVSELMTRELKSERA